MSNKVVMMVNRGEEISPFEHPNHSVGVLKNSKEVANLKPMELMRKNGRSDFSVKRTSIDKIHALLAISIAKAVFIAPPVVVRRLYIAPPVVVRRLYIAPSVVVGRLYMTVIDHVTKNFEGQIYLNELRERVLGSFKGEWKDRQLTVTIKTQSEPVFTAIFDPLGSTSTNDDNGYFDDSAKDIALVRLGSKMAQLNQPNNLMGLGQGISEFKLLMSSEAVTDHEIATLLAEMIWKAAHLVHATM